MNDGAFVDLLGGTAAVARRVRAKQASVSEWKSRGLPELRVIQLGAGIEQAGGPPRWRLRPDDWYLIWPELKGAEGAPTLPDAQPEAT